MGRLFITLVLCLALPLAWSADDATGADTAAALRQLQEDLLTAANAGDLTALRKLLAPACRITFLDQTTAKPDDILAALTEGKQRYQITNWAISVETDGSFALPRDDTAILTGDGKEQYTTLGGQKLSMPVRWTATVVKHDGVWKLEALHLGTNPSDNPFVNTISKGMERFAYLTATLALIVGAISGFVLGRLSKRGKAADQDASATA